MNVKETGGSEIAWKVEGAEVGAAGCLFPVIQAWYRHSAVFRGSGYGKEIEIIGSGNKRLMGEDSVDSSAGGVIEVVGIGLCVAFGENGHVDSLVRVGAAMYIAMRRRGELAEVGYEIVGGIKWMEDSRYGVVATVEEFDFDINLGVGERNKKSIFESTGALGTLGCGKPFLIESGE